MRYLIAILTAVMFAITAAAVIWAWWLSPIPTFLVFTPVLHGIWLGVALAWVFDRFAIREPSRRASIAAMASILSVAALVGGQDVADAKIYHNQRQRAMSKFFPMPPHSAKAVLQEYDRSLLAPVTGRTGVIGYIMLQDRTAVWRRWLRVVDVLLVVAITSVLAARPAPLARPRG